MGGLREGRQRGGRKGNAMELPALISGPAPVSRGLICEHLAPPGDFAAIIAVFLRFFNVNPMRIITVNCNGIRSATTKGMFTWLKKQKADVICFHEIKALESDIPPEAQPWKDWHAFYQPAGEKGD